MEKNKQKLVIGIDGGGTKTVAALADLSGRILKMRKSGPSNPHGVGVENSVRIISDLIGAWAGSKKISSVFVGLADVEEDRKLASRIKKGILNKLKKFRGEIKIDSDQIVAFRSGTENKDGIVLIDGTGSVAHGWRGNADFAASGWGWPLADEGSAFWTGQRAFQATLKDLDGRGPETLIAKLALRKLRAKNIGDLISLVYSRETKELIPSFAIICDKVSRRGDKVAKKIMIEAGEEAALAAISVVKKLHFQKEKFPLVLIGGMFNSKILLDTVKKEVKKAAPKVEFIRPKSEPVSGAVKLAVDALGITRH